MAKSEVNTMPHSIDPRRTFASNAWSSRDFAAHTAGILAEMDYKTELVSSPGWPDGAHTRVIVGIPLHEKRQSGCR